MCDCGLDSVVSDYANNESAMLNKIEILEYDLKRLLEFVKSIANENNEAKELLYRLGAEI
jgi:hypothetical protein